jgi:hypothetical protein
MPLLSNDDGVQVLSAKLITVEELEQIVSDHRRAWKLINETKQGPEPEFPKLSGEFDPSCLIDAARACESEFPWLPDLLKNSGTGTWKYSGFVVFVDESNEANQPDTGSSHSATVVLDHKGLGQVVLSISEGRLYDIEIMELLF